MKYPDARAGDWEAVWNKLGGVDGVVRFLRGETMIVPVSTIPSSESVNQIFRLNAPFDPLTFIGPEWEEVTEERDTRAEVMDHLDLDMVQFVLTLKKGESTVDGEERLRRLKDTKWIRLGGKALKACWKKRHLLPESWKRDDAGKIRYIIFDGVVLIRPNGGRCSPSMHFDGNDWQRGYDSLHNSYGTSGQSAVI